MGGITTSWSMSFETKMLQVPPFDPFCLSRSHLIPFVGLDVEQLLRCGRRAQLG